MKVTAPNIIIFENHAMQQHGPIKGQRHPACSLLWPCPHGGKNIICSFYKLTFLEFHPSNSLHTLQAHYFQRCWLRQRWYAGGTLRSQSDLFSLTSQGTLSATVVRLYSRSATIRKSNKGFACRILNHARFDRSKRLPSNQRFACRIF